MKVDVIKKIEKASRVLQMNVLTTMCTNVLATVPDCEGKILPFLRNVVMMVTSGHHCFKRLKLHLPGSAWSSTNRILHYDVTCHVVKI